MDLRAEADYSITAYLPWERQSRFNPPPRIRQTPAIMGSVISRAAKGCRKQTPLKFNTFSLYGVVNFPVIHINISIANTLICNKGA